MLRAALRCGGRALAPALALLRCPAQGSGFERGVDGGLRVGSCRRRVFGRGTLAGEAQHGATAPCGRVGQASRYPEGGACKCTCCATEARQGGGRFYVQRKVLDLETRVLRLSLLRSALTRRTSRIAFNGKVSREGLRVRGRMSWSSS
eukprot:6177034-Pleurochrysis_carterae.AAC.1